MERGVASGAPRRSPRTAAGRAHRNGPDHGGPSPGSAPPSARRRRRGADARRGWGHRSYHRPRASGKRGHGRAPQPCRARRFARQEHRLAGGRVAGAGRFTRLPAPRLVGGSAELPVVFRFAQRSGELLADGVSTHRGAATETFGAEEPKRACHGGDTRGTPCWRPARSSPQADAASSLPAARALHAGTPMRRPGGVRRACRKSGRPAGHVIRHRIRERERQEPRPGRPPDSPFAPPAMAGREAGGNGQDGLDEDDPPRGS